MAEPADTHDAPRTLPRADTAVILGHLAVRGRPPFPVPEGRRVVLGRSTECDVVLEGEEIAERHCILRVSRVGLVIEDQGSKSGTLLNGVRVGRGLVEHGDRITIGHWTIDFASAAGARRRRWPRAVMGLCLVAVAAAVGVGAWLATHRAARPPAVDAHPVLIETTRKLVVDSEPQGAAVWLDGSHRGATPLALTLGTDGEHDVEVRHHGYLAWTTRVPAGAGEHRIDARLEKQPTGRLIVRAFPSNAAVHIDGAPAGKCPLEATVAPGRHEVAVSAAGYEALKALVDVPADGQLAVRWVLRCGDVSGLRNATGARPRDARAHFRLAQAMLTRGNVDGALPSVQLALGILASGRDMGNWRNVAGRELAGLYFDPPIPGATPEDLAALQSRLDGILRGIVLEYAPGKLLPSLVDIVSRAGKLALAETLCELAMARRPRTVEPYACLAALYLDWRRVDDAESVLILCGAARRGSADSCLKLAVAWARLAPHSPQARARAQAELERALAACATDDERWLIQEQFGLEAGAAKRGEPPAGDF